jgi:hypothetical protein
MRGAGRWLSLDLEHCARVANGHASLARSFKTIVGSDVAAASDASSNFVGRHAPLETPAPLPLDGFGDRSYGLLARRNGADVGCEGDIGLSSRSAAMKRNAVGSFRTMAIRPSL